MFRIEIELENPAELAEFYKDPGVQTPVLRLAAYHATRGALAKAVERNQKELIRTLCPLLVSMADDLPDDLPPTRGALAKDLPDDLPPLWLPEQTR